MMKKTLACVAVCSMVAGLSMADTYRFMGNGNWEDSQWQNQTAGMNNVAPPGSNDVARMNWGGATCTLSSSTYVQQLATGVDENGNLVVASGGYLTTSPTWSSIGHTTGETGTLTVETGGQVDFGSHLWIGYNTGATGLVNIAGTVSVGQMLGAGWNGGIGHITVEDGGTLDLFQLHGDGATSFKNGSTLNVTGSGQVVLPGNYTGVINAYIANGSIFGEGILGNVNIDVTGEAGVDQITTVTAIPEPATLGLMGIFGAAIYFKRCIASRR